MNLRNDVCLYDAGPIAGLQLGSKGAGIIVTRPSGFFWSCDGKLHLQLGSTINQPCSTSALRESFRGRMSSQIVHRTRLQSVGLEALVIHLRVRIIDRRHLSGSHRLSIMQAPCGFPFCHLWSIQIEQSPRFLRSGNKE